MSRLSKTRSDWVFIMSDSRRVWAGTQASYPCMKLFTQYILLTYSRQKECLLTGLPATTIKPVGNTVQESNWRHTCISWVVISQNDWTAHMTFLNASSMLEQMQYNTCIVHSLQDPSATENKDLTCSQKKHRKQKNSQWSCKCCKEGKQATPISCPYFSSCLRSVIIQCTAEIPPLLLAELVQGCKHPCCCQSVLWLLLQAPQHNFDQVQAHLALLQSALYLHKHSKAGHHPLTSSTSLSTQVVSA